MSIVQLHDKKFKPFISHQQIEESIQNLSVRIQEDYGDKKPLFLGVLNGSFLFFADLIREFDGDCEVSFVKLASYDGTNTTGEVHELVGLSENVEGRHVILVEDIVDTGTTLEKLHHILEDKNAASIKIATLLYKPNAYRKEFPIDYAAMEVGNEFLVGYGLDYDGLGRNLKDILIITE